MENINGVGIGTSVGLGMIISLGILSPEANLLGYVVVFTVYGSFTGFIFHVWQKALEGWKPPFMGR